MPIDAAFDRSGALKAPPWSRLPGELWSLAFNMPKRPDPASLPHGRGRAVLVIPALLTTDAYFSRLRAFLDACGFRAFASGIGINWGPTPAIRAGLHDRLTSVRSEAGGPIAVIGVSMGGLLARDLAYDRPGDIAHLVTVGAPVRLPTATTLEPVIRALARGYDTRLDFARFESPLPVPWTSIYSRGDGLLAWQSCVGDDSGLSVEVTGGHLDMALHPKALETIVRHLAPAS